jgi:Xaa-Pro aminopeptidase
MENRIKKLQANLQESEAVLLFESANRRYFTNFNSSAGVVIVTDKKAVFMVDFRYIENAKKQVKSMEVALFTDLVKQIAEFLKGENTNKVYLETDSIDLSLYSKLKANLEGIEISTDGKIQTAIDKLRAIKDSSEIGFIKQAQAITDKTFDYILNHIAVGKTEREIALEMEFFARKNGSDGIAFDFIVVSGKNSSLPHGVPTDKKLEKGDFLTMDFGARVNGYCSDMTRTVALGEVSDHQKRVYETVLTAQGMSASIVKAGVVCKDVDAIAREYIYENGYEGCFGHGLGHSLGLDIHENPAFNTRDETVLESGMVMTVEPGIYLENEFGVRIEDMVLVTDDGFENLTHSPKELIIL